jgi:nucleoid-associated protein YgaU
MAMREQDSLEPYEPSDPGYDWDYEPEDHSRNMPNIIWGRVAVLGAVVLLAFLIGRMTAGGGGVPEERLTSARSDLRDARAQVTDLQGQVEGLEKDLAAAQNPDTTEDPNADDDTEGGGEGEDTPTGEEYVIKAGDTLNTIAIEFYGDAEHADYIAVVNDIVDESAINAGDTITIPPEPE